jgi:hypothetical protein
VPLSIDLLGQFHQLLGCLARRLYLVALGKSAHGLTPANCADHDPFLQRFATSIVRRRQQLLRNLIYDHHLFSQSKFWFVFFFFAGLFDSSGELLMRGLFADHDDKHSFDNHFITLFNENHIHHVKHKLNVRVDNGPGHRTSEHDEHNANDAVISSY